MKKISIIILIFGMIVIPFDLFSQQGLENLVPKPRQAYIREVFSATFAISKNKKIYLDSEAPDYAAAYELNAGLRKLQLDTLQYTLLTSEDTIINGIALGENSSRINQLFQKIPDQKIAVTKDFPGAEGYVIDVMPQQVIIAGCDRNGLHYGITSFLQLFGSAGVKNQIFACRIIDAPQFKNRWMMYSMNFQVPAQTTLAKQYWSEAALYKMNGINVNDFKFNILEGRPKNYYDSLKSAVKFAKDNYLKFKPGVFPFGYSDGILYHNVNLASGLPVSNQQFLIQGDTGKLIQHKDVALSNPGFENHNGDNFTGFSWIDEPGKKSFADANINHSGTVSLRFDFDPANYSKNGNYRINVRRLVEPFSYYHVSAYYKTENQQTDETHVMVLGDNGKVLNFYSPPIEKTTDWKKLDIVFNSLESDTVFIYWGSWGGFSGKIWWDDLQVEEIGLVNILRRPGCPLHVGKKYLDMIFTEGVDYDTLRDPKLGMVSWPGTYDAYHTPPTFRIKPSDNIRNGDTILLSYYHPVLIYDGQIMCSMTEPETYTIIEKQFRMLDSLVKADTYFMGHDEIRTMNWDAGDLATGKTPAGILADNVNKCFDIINKYVPNADIWDWSDMFDEFHNAVKGNYYLVNGDLRGSADIIPKEIGIMNWAGKLDSSLNFFNKRGFRQMVTPYIDADESSDKLVNERIIRIKKEKAANTPNMLGMMYVTWTNKFDHIKQFAEYAWNHAPYIYHYPPSIQKNPSGDFPISVRITGDEMDVDWQLVSASINYRTNEKDAFSQISFKPKAGTDTTITLNLPSENESLQYYMEATDNRGWTTKIPYGVNKYYEYGLSTSSVLNESTFNNLYFIDIYPNPAEEAKVEVEWLSPSSFDAEFSIINILGQVEKRIIVNNVESGQNRTTIDLSGIPSGIYLLNLRINNNSVSKKIIIK
ncbi:MAG: putative glycosyl hydrolase [Ignavibacteria bacterium]|nr:putative glycosyl hydrolase [Ignavibacteria bacterium]